MKEKYIPSHQREGYDESKVVVLPPEDPTPKASNFGGRERDGANAGLSPNAWRKQSNDLENHRRNKKKARLYKRKLRRKVRLIEAQERAEMDIVYEAKKRF